MIFIRSRGAMSFDRTFRFVGLGRGRHFRALAALSCGAGPASCCAAEAGMGFWPTSGCAASTTTKATAKKNLLSMRDFLRIRSRMKIILLVNHGTQARSIDADSAQED